MLSNKYYVDLILSEAYKLETYYMALVDEDNRANFYDGKVRVVDPHGAEYLKFDARDYDQYIGEWVEPWTYIKLNHLSKLGWQGLKEGDGTSLYRVAPLGEVERGRCHAEPAGAKRGGDHV